MHQFQGMEDENEDNFDDIAFMPSRHMLLKMGGISAAVLAVAVVLWGLSETNKNTNLSFQGNRRATDIRPRAANPLRESSYKDPASPVGTSGILASDATTTSTTPIQDLKALLGTDDPVALAGRRVEIEVPTLAEHNPTTFWIGGAEDRLLVVMGRDTRNGSERQASAAPAHDIAPGRAGQQTSISGIVQRVPTAEGRFNWDLTSSQTRELKRRGVFILADRVRPTAVAGAGAVDGGL